MPRLPALDPADAEDDVARVLDRVPPLAIFRMVANAQGAFPAWMRFGGKLLDERELDPVLRELAILRVARMTPGADYEWAQHVAIMRAVGGTQAQIDALAADELEAEALGDDGRLVVAFTTQVVRDCAPDDGTLAALRERLTTREIVHLLLVIGQYMMLGRIMATSRLELDAVLGADLVSPRDDAA